MTDLDSTFSALASAPRRAILADLLSGPTTVTKLAEPRGMSLPAVSQHLKVLENAGLIARDIRGREHHIRLEHEAITHVWDWLDQHRTFWEGRLDSLAAFLSAESAEGDKD